MLIHCWTEHRLLLTSNPLAEICNDIFLTCVFLFHFKTKKAESVYFVHSLMRSAQSYKHYIYARCCPGQVGRWNLIVACGMFKPVYFAFVETMLEFLCKLHILYLGSRGPFSEYLRWNKQCLRLILKALSPQHFAPRWRGLAANHQYR